mmetsp:Transcript_26869/g.29737  ORF Transcript_26869/g.29737 Transcript_26869/m.29737 type:complete len:104 (-) Transcript_26869:23-334(-)
MLIGATQEFKKDALSQSEFVKELKNRSYNLAPTLWDNSTVHAITCGYRAQSQRVNLGRVPMIGHHGIYGGKLVDMILASYNNENECAITKQYPHLNWWKKKFT